jgi:hypothetical protein
MFSIAEGYLGLAERSERGVEVAWAEIAENFSGA